jgi:hypothetical protein
MKKDRKYRFNGCVYAWMLYVGLNQTVLIQKLVILKGRLMFESFFISIEGNGKDGFRDISKVFGGKFKFFCAYVFHRAHKLRG